MTKTQRLTVVLTVVNLVVLVILFMDGRNVAVAEPVLPILRGRALELVDASGQVRVQFNVESDGEAVFRMRDSGGAIRVKLGAGSNGSGLLLLDETTEPGVHMIAKRAATPHGATTTSITLSGVDGRRRVFTP